MHTEVGVSTALLSSIDGVVFSEEVVQRVVDFVPESLAIVLGVLSHLGSVWFVVPAVLAAFFVHRSERSTAWLGIVGGAYGYMIAVKSLFTIDRPAVSPPVEPDAIHPVARVVYEPSVEIATTAFPSGHVAIAVVVWGLFVLESDLGTDSLRVGAAISAVLLVSLARIGLGVHYPIDVLAGLLAGLVYLLAVSGFIDRVQKRATVAFAIGIVGAWLGSALRVDPLPVLLFGGLIGGLLGWLLVHRSRLDDRDRIAGVLAVAACPTVLPVVSTAGSTLLLVGLVAGGVIVFVPLSLTSSVGSMRIESVAEAD